MSDLSGPPAEPRSSDLVGGAPDEEHTRQVAATTVAAALIGWWPAFTLGVYGVVFFEQIFAVWVASTTVFLVVLMSQPARVRRQPAWLALLVPSLWMSLALALPPGGVTAFHRALFFFGVLVTIVGFPAFAALLVRILLPGARRLRGHDAQIAYSVVLFVMAASFLLGRAHPQVLTCDDFTISGNFAPPGCTPGTGTTLQSLTPRESGAA